MKKLLLILALTTYSFSSSLKYEKSLNIVTDATNKLMWQDDNEVTQYLETFTTAKVYCDILVLNGYIDWRVPTIKEIQDIVDVRRKNSIDKNFQFLQQKIYTTQSEFKDDDSFIWAIDFASGKTLMVKKNQAHYIRCIRDIK